MPGLGAGFTTDYNGFVSQETALNTHRYADGKQKRKTNRSTCTTCNEYLLCCLYTGSLSLSLLLQHLECLSNLPCYSALHTHVHRKKMSMLSSKKLSLRCSPFLSLSLFRSYSVALLAARSKIASTLGQVGVAQRGEKVKRLKKEALARLPLRLLRKPWR